MCAEDAGNWMEKMDGIGWLGSGWREFNKHWLLSIITSTGTSKGPGLAGESGNSVCPDDMGSP